MEKVSSGFPAQVFMTETTLSGIVTRAHGNRFRVFAGNRDYDCLLRKRIKFETEGSTPVAVGDDVVISLIADDEGVIEEVKERSSVLSRPMIGRQDIEHVIAANIDALVIIVSVDEPPLKPGLIDRFLIASRLGGLSPAIALNKIDLGLDDTSREVIAVYTALEYPLFQVSALKNVGLDQLTRFLDNRKSILAGHSGVGKSSILNRILPDSDIRTSEISQATGRGKHTTSHVELFHLPTGGFVVDTPGLKVLGLWQLEKEDLPGYYPEFEPFAPDCRFSSCRHIHEPDCAIKAAVARNDIFPLRYNNYVQIYGSLEDTDR